jgi:hypothetical protein
VKEATEQQGKGGIMSGESTATQLRHPHCKSFFVARGKRWRYTTAQNKCIDCSQLTRRGGDDDEEGKDAGEHLELL